MAVDARHRPKHGRQAWGEQAGKLSLSLSLSVSVSLSLSERRECTQLAPNVMARKMIAAWLSGAMDM